MQILTSVKLKHTSVTSTPFVSTRKDLIYVAVKRDIVATATPAQVHNYLKSMHSFSLSFTDVYMFTLFSIFPAL